MSREIDKWPATAQSTGRMKVVIASCSRTGTLGLYTAMGMLGYKPYHMLEVVLNGGMPHMKVLEQGVVAQHNRFSGIKRYGFAEFEKWLDGYDCLVELASYMGSEAIEAYLQDPDIKFILTERDSDKWAKSFNSTVAQICIDSKRFPLNILKWGSPFLRKFLDLNCVMYEAWSDGTYPGNPNNTENLRRNNIEYNRMVKDRVPADRLCVIKLEDGLGWEEICPFLGKPIPEQPYPRGNEGAEFQERAKAFIGGHAQKAMINLGIVAAATIGVGAWFAMQYGPALYAKVLDRLS